MKRRRKNPDPELRRLERAAAAGDPAALDKLRRALRRAGMLWHPATGLLLQQGDRVRFRETITLEDALVEAGETATVYGHTTPAGADLLLDRTHLGLEEWNNLVIWDDGSTFPETSNETLELLPPLRLPKYFPFLRDEVLQAADEEGPVLEALWPVLIDVGMSPYHSPFTLGDRRVIVEQVLNASPDQVRFYAWYFRQAIQQENPMKHAQMTPKAKAFVSSEIRRQMRKGKSQAQAVRIAFEVARKKRFRVPKARNPDVDLRRLERRAAEGGPEDAARYLAALQRYDPVVGLAISRLESAAKGGVGAQALARLIRAVETTTGMVGVHGRNDGTGWPVVSAIVLGVAEGPTWGAWKKEQVIEFQVTKMTWLIGPWLAGAMGIGAGFGALMDLKPEIGEPFPIRSPGHMPMHGTGFAVPVPIARLWARTQENPMKPNPKFDPERHAYHGGRRVHPLAYEARQRYHEDLVAGHDAAAEYWRGQAGAFFTNPKKGEKRWRVFQAGYEVGHVWAKNERDALELALERYGWGGPVSVQLVRSTNKAPKRSRKAKKPKAKRRNPLLASMGNPPEIHDGARIQLRGKAAEKAKRRYKKFHGHEAQNATLVRIDDGKQKTTRKVVVALGTVPETHYQVPWPDSNKNGYYWVHPHPEGDEPLEVLDPETEMTMKIPGSKTRVTDWWYE